MVSRHAIHVLPTVSLSIMYRQNTIATSWRSAITALAPNFTSWNLIAMYISIRIAARMTENIAFLDISLLTDPLITFASLTSAPSLSVSALRTLDICESSVPSSESSGILNTISFVPDTVCTDIPASPIPAASAMTGTISFSASLSEYSLSKPTVRLVPPANSTLKLSGEPFDLLLTGIIQKHAMITMSDPSIQNLPAFTKFVFFGSLATPKYLASVTPRFTSAVSSDWLTARAVNTERTTPIASVIANPLIVPVPNIPSTRAAISVVTLPSMMADRALWKPPFTACFTDLPSASSSLIRVNMITLASTAIPTDRITPAIPGSVSVTLNRLSTSRSSIV